MKKATKLFYVALFAVVALNGFVISNAFANVSESIEPGNKADCYSSFDTGTVTFFQCMTCIEKTGSPLGETGVCRD